jgi:hypothetical protein
VKNDFRLIEPTPSSIRGTTTLCGTCAATSLNRLKNCSYHCVRSKSLREVSESGRKLLRHAAPPTLSPQESLRRGVPSTMKDLWLKMHEELVAEYLDTHPGMSWTTAYELTAEHVNGRLIEKYTAAADWQQMEEE